MFAYILIVFEDFYTVLLQSIAFVQQAGKTAHAQIVSMYLYNKTIPCNTNEVYATVEKAQIKRPKGTKKEHFSVS